MVTGPADISVAVPGHRCPLGKGYAAVHHC